MFCIVVKQTEKKPFTKKTIHNMILTDKEGTRSLIMVGINCYTIDPAKKHHPIQPHWWRWA